MDKAAILSAVRQEFFQASLGHVRYRTAEHRAGRQWGCGPQLSVLPKANPDHRPVRRAPHGRRDAKDSGGCGTLNT